MQCVLSKFVLVTLLCLLPLSPLQSDSLLRNFESISAIVNVDAALCSCPCSFRADLVDARGDTLLLCWGYDPRIPHHGFRIGVVGTDPAALEIVEIGSQDDIHLLNNINNYLNRNYSFEWIERLNNSGWDKDMTDEVRSVYPILQILKLREHGIALEHWLNVNYTVAEQDSILAAGFCNLKTERDKEAFFLLCQLVNGLFISSSEEDGCFECRRWVP